MRDDPGGQSQRDAWAYLKGLGVDIALVQEAAPPPYADPALWAVRSHPAPDRPDEWFTHPRYRRWGTAAVVLNQELGFEPIESTPLNSDRHRVGLWVSHPGTWSGIRVLRPELPPINLISVYAAWDQRNEAEDFCYYQTTVNRIIADLTPLLDSEAGRWTVVAGDFNIGTQFTETTDEPYRWGASIRATYDRIAAFGLSDCIAVGVPTDRGPLANCMCGPAPDCQHVQTYRHDNKPDGKPWQNEHMFATKPFVDALIACAPVDDDAGWTLSDHCPVIAEFDI